MAIYAIADLHLSVAVPEKDMAIFGPPWPGYVEKIAKHWRNKISDRDLVLLPGDISWASNLEQALIDLAWIDALPGTKLMIRGNHDYWWSSLSKMRKVLPPSIFALQNNAYQWGNVAIAGARLWDCNEFSFSGGMEFNPVRLPPDPGDPGEKQKIYQRELHRLELSLSKLPKSLSARIAMLHYPPVGRDLAPSSASALLEKHAIQKCVFGHLHSIDPSWVHFGSARGVEYLFVAADNLLFEPRLIHAAEADDLIEL